MKTLFVMILASVLLYPQIASAGWGGKTARVEAGGIGCLTLSMTEEMYLFAKAGNTKAQNSYYSANKCVKFPNEVEVTVVKDASTFTDPDQAEVMFFLKDGDTIRLWFLMEHLRCCYAN